MNHGDLLLEKYRELYLKSRRHLEFSLHRVMNLPKISPTTPDEELEIWESFASRFARASDLYVAQVLRLKILGKDPGFRGSIIDQFHEAEKYSWIDDAQKWLRIRQLRNVAAHEYTIDDLASLYQELITLTPTILAAKV